RAKMIRESIDIADAKKVLGYGYIPRVDQTTCRMNTAGLIAYYRSVDAGFVLTCRTADGKGSGWAGVTGVKDVSLIDFEKMTNTASDKANLSHSAKPLEPGKYTVILEPRANARFLSLMTGIFGQGGG